MILVIIGMKVMVVVVWENISGVVKYRIIERNYGVECRIEVFVWVRIFI